MKRIALPAGLLFALAAYAAPFADPTQPPGAVDLAADPALGGPRVESILIAPDRRLAVINGQQVTVGSKVGAGAVVRITETEVVIRGGDGEQTLRLFPQLSSRSETPKKGRSQ